MSLLRRFLIVFLLSFSGSMAWAFEPPSKPDGYVTDLAKVISPATRKTLIYKLDNLATKSAYKPQMVILTVPTLEDTPIFTAATDTFKKWKLGLKDKDNGILILLDKKENAIRIEIGYGIEQYMTALHLSDFIDKSKVYLNKGDYDTVMSMLVTDISSLLQNVEEPKKSAGVKSNLSVFLITILVIFLTFIIFTKRSANRRRERFARLEKQRKNKLAEEALKRYEHFLSQRQDETTRKSTGTPLPPNNIANRLKNSNRVKSTPSPSSLKDDGIDLGFAIIGGIVGSMLSNSGSNSNSSSETSFNGGGGETGGGGYSDSGSSSSDSGGGD